MNPIKWMQLLCWIYSRKSGSVLSKATIPCEEESWLTVECVVHWSTAPL